MEGKGFPKFFNKEKESTKDVAKVNLNAKEEKAPVVSNVAPILDIMLQKKLFANKNIIKFFLEGFLNTQAEKFEIEYFKENPKKDEMKEVRNIF